MLYELVTGQQPFQGPSKLSTLSAILKEEPKPPSTIAPAIPHDLEKLITRCLRKDPAKRFQHMDDVKVALEELKEESDSGTLAPAGPVARPRFRWGWAVALVVAAVGLAAAGWLLFSRGDRSLPPPSLVQVTSTSGTKNWPALSPDGKQVAFQWTGEDGQNEDIYVQVIGETTALRLTRDPAPDEMPVWSPDGSRIAFRRGTSLFTMSAVTGSEQKVTDVPDLIGVGSWSPDGTWLAVARGRPAKVEGDDPAGLYLVPVAGGEPVRLTAPKAPLLDRMPRFSWDGRFVAFVRYQPPGFTSTLFVQALTREGQAQGNPRQLTDTGMADWRAGVASGRPLGRLQCVACPRADPSVPRTPRGRRRPRAPRGRGVSVHRSPRRRHEVTGWCSAQSDGQYGHLAPPPGRHAGAADPVVARGLLA